jgi:hypothetical protein
MHLRPSLDDLRRLRPDLSFALFAMDPGAAVTLEIYHDGQVYTFGGATVADAILLAFPPPAETPAPPQPDTSIFD